MTLLIHRRISKHLQTGHTNHITLLMQGSSYMMTDKTSMSRFAKTPFDAIRKGVSEKFEDIKHCYQFLHIAKIRLVYTRIRQHIAILAKTLAYRQSRLTDWTLLRTSRRSVTNKGVEGLEFLIH